MRKCMYLLAAVIAATACGAEGDRMSVVKDSFGLILTDAHYEDVAVTTDPDAGDYYVAQGTIGSCTISFRKKADDRSDGYTIIAVTKDGVQTPLGLTVTKDGGPADAESLKLRLAQEEPMDPWNKPIYC